MVIRLERFAGTVTQKQRWRFPLPPGRLVGFCNFGQELLESRAGPVQRLLAIFSDATRYGVSVAGDAERPVPDARRNVTGTTEGE
jgi:hypothetical protein